MNPATIRVAINFNTVRKPIIFDVGVEEQDLLKIALKLFGLEGENCEDYELIISNLKCRVVNSKYLVNDDILILKLKYLQEMVFDKSQISNYQELSKRKTSETSNEELKGNSEYDSLSQSQSFNSEQEDLF